MMKYSLMFPFLKILFYLISSFLITAKVASSKPIINKAETKILLVDTVEYLTVWGYWKDALSFLKQTLAHLTKTVHCPSF